VLKALAKDPADRFQTANEFLSALDAAEADPSARLYGTAAYPPVVVGEEPEEESWLKRNRWWVIGAVLLLAAALVAWAILSGKDQVTVPPVIGKTAGEARSLLERQGFDASLTTVESCKPANTVIEQDPPSGSKADEGSTVNLTVSLGQSVRIPDVVGDAAEDATKELEDDQLTVATQKRASSKQAGTVIETEPAAGEEVACGSEVTLFVSKGVNLISLPDFTGLSQEDAESQLDGLGLIANVDTRDADEPEGTVISQSPPAGAEVERGDTVRLVVSSGAGSVVVSDVIGQPADTAISQLEALGANVDVERQETDVRSEDGRVLDQAPAAGTRIREGDTVTIFVGQFVEPEPTTTTTTTTTSPTTTDQTTTTPKR
jgi:serine/threonine-protein kinase